MTNFDIFTSAPQFEPFASVAVSAERILHIDPSACVLNCRRAMEFAVKWMYSVDKALVMPYQDTLVSLMNTEDFRDIVGTDLWRRMDFIRRAGNNAAHSGKKITEEQAALCLENLYVFLDFVAYCYGENYTEGHFDRSLLTQPAAPAAQGDSPAKGVGVSKAREGSNPSFCAKSTKNQSKRLILGTFSLPKFKIFACLNRPYTLIGSIEFCKVLMRSLHRSLHACSLPLFVFTLGTAHVAA